MILKKVVNREFTLDLSFLEEAQAFYQSLVDSAVVIYDNSDRLNSISKVYTAGRNSDGALNGHITSNDIKTMQHMGGTCHDMDFDTLVVPIAVWAELLRQPAFSEILHGPLVIVPTDRIPVDTVNDTSSVLLLDSHDLSKVVVAKSVKLS